VTGQPKRLFCSAVRKIRPETLHGM
jgi:hypothetical protein